MHEHEYDKDRKRSPAAKTGHGYEYRMLAPGSVSMSSLMQRPEHPIPSGLTDYKLSPVPPDRAPIPQSARGPEHGRSNAPRVVLLILPAKLAPGSVSMSSFLQRPENPIPSWFSGEAAVAAYQERQRQASAVRPEDRALGELLDATLERVRAKREAAAASVAVAAPSPGAALGVGTSKATEAPPRQAEPVSPGGRQSPDLRNAMTEGPPQHVESPRRSFDDYRVHGLQELLQRLGPSHARQDTLAAATDADRSIAWRAKRWLEPLPDVPAPTPNGRALWRAAERHATTLFRRAVGRGMVDVTDPAVESALQQRGAGELLPLELRRAMERELGVELEGVRLHTDAVAAEAASALGAEAFTVGEDIFFAAGMFSPDTRSGRQLLAHELTHVAQALRGHVHAAGEGLQVSQPGEPLEQEADAIARRVDAAPMPTAGGPERSGPEQRSDHTTSAPAPRAPSSTFVLRAPAKAAPAKLEFPYAVHITAIIDSDHLLLEFIKQYRGVQTDADAAALRDKERWHWHSTQPQVTQADVVKGYVLVTVTDASIKPSTASDKKERAQHLKQLPPGDQAAINTQADQEFWDKTRFRVGQQLGSSADDQRMAGTWQLLRDELIRKREAIDALPPDLRKFLFDDQAPKLAPKDYDAALSIMAKIAALTPAELAEYKSRITAKTTDWTVYKQSIDRFVTERGEREAAGAERRTSETKLALLEPLYERYRKYRSMLMTSAAAAAVSAANPQGAGASLGMQPTLNKMQVELDADLVKAGFPGGITDFEQLIHQYETQFERETLAIANVMLDQYAHTLFVQEEGYRASGQPLYQAVTGRQAGADYDEADKIRSEHATGIVLTPGEMADQAHWVGKRNEALAQGDAKMRNVAAAHPLVNNSDFDRQALARVSSETEAQSLMLGYIAARKQDIAATRTNLTAKPTTIYGLDALLQASFRAQNIQSGSIYDRIIHDHISDVHFAEAIPQFILAAIAIAAGAFTGGTGTVAVLGAGTALGIGAYQAVEEFRRYEAQSAAYGAQLTSDDPTMAWVVVAVIGAGIDAAVFASVLPKLRPALAAFNAGAEANDVAALERKLAKLGDVKDGVKQSIIRAAEAETEARAAWKAAFRPTAALRAVIVPGAEEFGRFVYAVYLTIKRGIREFQVFVKTNEALDLIGDVAKLSAEELAALKTGYLEAIKELEDIAKHGRKLGMSEAEILEFMNLRGNAKGMSVADVTAKMDAAAATKAGGGAVEKAEQAAQQAIKSAAGNAEANATKKYLFESSEKAVVEKNVRDVAEQAAEQAHKDAIAAGKTPAQANTAANKAAKDAAEKVAKEEAERAAKEAAQRAIDNGGVFDMGEIDAKTQGQLANFNTGKTGGEAKRLAGELDGLSEKEFLAKMAGEPSTAKSVNIVGPPPQTMHVYEYPDGTVVRYKPLGDPKRPGPSYSVEVKKDPSLPDLGKGDAGFKVDSSGRAVPKGPFEIKNPYPTGSVQADAFREETMNAGHRVLR